MTIRAIFFVTSIFAFGVIFANVFMQHRFNDISPAAGGKTTLDRVLERNEIRCGYINYAPYFSKDPNSGKVSGVMVDLMDEVSNKLDMKVIWAEETSWGSMIEGLRTKRFDAVCSSVWQNPLRAKFSTFSMPIGYAPVYAYVRQNDTRFSALRDLNKRDITISTMDGEMNHFLAEELFPNAKRKALPQTAAFSDVIVNVTTGKADVVFLEPKVAEDFLKSSPATLKRLKMPVRAYPVTLAMGKKAFDLKHMLDAAIHEIVTSPSWTDTLKAHALDDLKPVLNGMN